MTQTRLLPPVVLLVALAVMVGLHIVWPGPRFDGPAVALGGGAVAIGGLGLMVFAAGLFRRRGTAVRPFHESSLLVVEGPFRFTRNPMYLGMTLMLSGTGLALGSSIPLVTVPLFAGFITWRFILVEEQLLTTRFGADYEAYCAQVRRWL
jgi:protein-S-isoprenylcysteine O-methyltransferase Ste14